MQLKRDVLPALSDKGVKAFYVTIASPEASLAEAAALGPIHSLPAGAKRPGAYPRASPPAEAALSLRPAAAIARLPGL